MDQNQDALSNGYSENEANGFWGVLARKGKDILEESQVIILALLFSSPFRGAELRGVKGFN